MSNDSSRLPLDAEELSTFSAFGPTGLTQKQVDEMIRAAEYLKGSVWKNAKAAAANRRFLDRNLTQEDS